MKDAEIQKLSVQEKMDINIIKLKTFTGYLIHHCDLDSFFPSFDTTEVVRGNYEMEVECGYSKENSLPQVPTLKKISTTHWYGSGDVFDLNNEKLRKEKLGGLK